MQPALRSEAEVGLVAVQKGASPSSFLPCLLASSAPTFALASLRYICGHATYTHAVRLKIIGNEIIKTVGKYESRMVSKLPIIFKRTRAYMNGPYFRKHARLISTCILGAC